jgi:hypothetical protein
MLYIGCIRHIGLDSDGLSAVALNFGYYFFGLGGIAGEVHYNREPIVCRPCRYSTSDST